jgi:hypothetical protein
MCTLGPIKAIWCQSYSRPCEGVIARKRWRGRPIPRFLLQRASRVAIPAEIDANYIKALQGNRYPSVSHCHYHSKNCRRCIFTDCPPSFWFLCRCFVGSRGNIRRLMFQRTIPNATCGRASFTPPPLSSRPLASFSLSLTSLMFLHTRDIYPRNATRNERRNALPSVSCPWSGLARLFSFSKFSRHACKGEKHQKHQKPRGIVISVDTIIACTEKQTGTLRGSLLKPIGSPPKISLRLPGGPVGHFLFTTPGETRAC